ncbi:dihydrofolate reductase [Candidatus Peregrinibacteria bacterium]|nr:dihydrofolate reductase [Candidatus Peregrinibacteria bacterium]
MRKVIFQMMVSLDGFIEGPKQDLSWHLVDDEFNKYAIDLLHSIDTIIFGRIAYELFESFWPAAMTDPSTTPDNLDIANQINDMHKIVFSKTMEKVEWKKSQLIQQLIPEEITKMKQQEGKDMVIFGGAGIAQSFMRHELIDEYRIMVNPIILGKGKPLFEDMTHRMNLKLLKTRTFNSGVVMLVYEPIKAGA